ncbi:unnamed protein product [Rotaria sp. Silwood2]|nr:unnamed protein product [Rotaria sp. Silwood2]
MLSGEQFKNINKDDKLELLFCAIDDRRIPANKIEKYVRERIYINYENKKWQDVIDDIKTFEQTNKSTLFSILKIKAEFQEFCRKARLSIIKMMNDGDHTEGHEKLFFSISQNKCENLGFKSECCVYFKK